MSQIVTDAVFSSRANIAPQEVGKPWIWFSSNCAPPPKEDYLWLKDAHVAFIETTDFHTIDGDIGLTYAYWDINADIRFWSNVLPSHSFAEEFAKLDSTNAIKRQDVLVCKAGWKPFGEYISRIFTRPERINCLLVQNFGQRNHIPCNCCAHRYATACMPVQDQQVNINWPFLECISMEKFFNGKCGNCIYHAESGCDYTKDSPCIKAHSARRCNSFWELGPRRAFNKSPPLNVYGEIKGMVKSQYKRMRENSSSHNQIEWVPIVCKDWYPQEIVPPAKAASAATKRGASGSGQAAARPPSRNKDMGKSKAVAGSRVEKRTKSASHAPQGGSSAVNEEALADALGGINLSRPKDTRRDMDDDIYGA